MQEDGVPSECVRTREPFTCSDGITSASLTTNSLLARRCRPQRRRRRQSRAPQRRLLSARRAGLGHESNPHAIRRAPSLRVSTPRSGRAHAARRRAARRAARVAAPSSHTLGKLPKANIALAWLRRPRRASFKRGFGVVALVYGMPPSSRLIGNAHTPRPTPCNVCQAAAASPKAQPLWCMVRRQRATAGRPAPWQTHPARRTRPMRRCPPPEARG